MRREQENSFMVPGIILGVTIGGLIGGSYLFLNTRAGKRFKRNLAGRYSDVRENIDEFIEALNDNVIKNLDKRSATLSKKVKKAVEYVRDEIDSFTNAKHPQFRNGIMIGAAIGGLLGLGALFLLQSQFSEEGEEFLERLGNRASRWKKSFNDVLEAFEDQGLHRNGSSKHEEANPVSEAIHLAQAGYNLWNGFNKGKRGHR